MDKYVKMVLDLYKECLTETRNGNQVKQDLILDVQKSISCAITEAKILDKPHDDLKQLLEYAKNVSNR